VGYIGRTKIHRNINLNMENNFDSVMSKKTNEELINIVTIDVKKYQEAAIESARKEIEIRNIDTTKFQEIAGKLDFEKQKQDDLESNTVTSSVRFINFIIDSIIVFLLYLLVGVLSALVFGIESNSSYFLFLFLIIASFLFYYTFMEFKFQKTVAKFITKTTVVNSDGEKANLNDIFIRTICRCIPFDRISFLFTKNGFHDRFSNTTVIKD